MKAFDLGQSRIIEEENHPNIVNHLERVLCLMAWTNKHQPSI